MPNLVGQQEKKLQIKRRGETYFGIESRGPIRLCNNPGIDSKFQDSRWRIDHMKPRNDRNDKHTEI